MKPSESLRLTALSVLLVCGLAACSSASEQAGIEGQRIGDYGLTATVPAGWHRVPLDNLPGAKVPLEIASFRPEGSVRTICNPASIVNQIPPGGALLQILDDRGFGGARGHQAGAVSAGPISAYPPLPRPFHLGQLQGHECGEAYNFFFRKAKRTFQLRIWTTPVGPNPSVRRQIERMIDSLRLRSL
jgi:hypothetical protein